MNKYDVIKDVKGNGLNLSDMIPLIDIKNEEDLIKYEKKGLIAPFTLEDFRRKFPKVDYRNIYFKPSDYLVETIYFSIDEYIFRKLPIYTDCQMLKLNNDKSDEEELLTYINIMTEAYKTKDYTTLLYMPPDSLRFEILFKMVKDKYIEKDEVYDVFRDLYSSSEFGFNKFNTELINDLISYQTMEFKKDLKERLSDYNDEIVVYRGEGDSSTSYREGALSWSLDINVSNFFACRYSTNDSKILIGKVKKENIIDYITDRNEDEVLIKPEYINLTDTIECYGLSKFNDSFLIDGSVYGKYREILRNIPFKANKEHGKLHSLRVLFLSLIIAMELDLSDDEVELLAISFNKS